MRCAIRLFACIVIGLVVCYWPARADVGVKKPETGVEVTLEWQPFRNGVFNAGFQAIIWPIVGPTGKEMTRPGRLRELPPGAIAKRPITYIKNRSGSTTATSMASTLGRDGSAARQASSDRSGQGRGGQSRTIVTRNDCPGRWRKRCFMTFAPCVSAATTCCGIDFDVVVTSAGDGVTCRRYEGRLLRPANRRVDAGR